MDWQKKKKSERNIPSRLPFLIKIMRRFMLLHPPRRLLSWQSCAGGNHINHNINGRNVWLVELNNPPNLEGRICLSKLFHLFLLFCLLFLIFLYCYSRHAANFFTYFPCFVCFFYSFLLLISPCSQLFCLFLLICLLFLLFHYCYSCHAANFSTYFSCFVCFYPPLYFHPHLLFGLTLR